MRKARLIYESERAGFMADHKSVSAQLTLGNFPTPLSNLTPLLGPPLPWETHHGRWGGPSGSRHRLARQPHSALAGAKRREHGGADELDEERSKDSEDRGGR